MVGGREVDLLRRRDAERLAERVGEAGVAGAGEPGRDEDARVLTILANMKLALVRKCWGGLAEPIECCVVLLLARVVDVDCLV